MGTAERRYKIMKTMCRRRYETIRNLASEFGVSMRTIQRDIEVLSETEPIYTKFGKKLRSFYKCKSREKPL
jgi:predicted DNA-binding transcriptional regulator YafY